MKPKKRKRVANEVGHSREKTDQSQSRTAKVVMNEKISPEKEKEVTEKENLNVRSLLLRVGILM